MKILELILVIFVVWLLVTALFGAATYSRLTYKDLESGQLKVQCK